MAKKKTAEPEAPASKPKMGRKPYVTPEMRQHCASAIQLWREEVGRNAGREGPATQQEFADFLGVRVYDVSDWEQAKRLPGREISIRICDRLGVHPRDITSGSPPHLAPGIRLHAFTLRSIDDLADPVIQATLERLVDDHDRKNFDKRSAQARAERSTSRKAR